MPARIQEDYEALLQDDQLLSVREEIAREKAYYRDIERRGQDGSIVCLAVFSAIAKVGTAADALVKARAGKKTDALRKALDGLMASINALIATTDPAVTEAGIRSELRDCRAAMKDLVKVESQHVERLYNMITTERAFAIKAAETAAFFKALEQHVPDSAVRTAIKRSVSDEFRRLAYRRDHPAVDAGGRREAGAAVLAAEAED